MVRAALKRVERNGDDPNLEDDLILFNVLLAGKIAEDLHWSLTAENLEALAQDFLQLNAMAYFEVSERKAEDRSQKGRDPRVPIFQLEINEGEYPTEKARGSAKQETGTGSWNLRLNQPGKGHQEDVS